MRLYDFGTTPEGDAYYVMELLSGLDQLVRRHGPQPPGRVVHILRQACSSLAEAHARGLVHRDIKPSNLQVGRYDLDHEVVKVLDFGLVKRPVSDEDGDVALSGAGEVMGTPAYIAPEVAVAEPDVDGRADLYGLGCVAWFLLTGEPPFRGRSAMAVMLAHVNDDPDADALSAAQPVPLPLERLMLECLAKTPEDRPESATRLALRLDTIALALPEPWTATRAEAWWSEHEGPGEAG